MYFRHCQLFFSFFRVVNDNNEKIRTTNLTSVSTIIQFSDNPADFCVIDDDSLVILVDGVLSYYNVTANGTWEKTQDITPDRSISPVMALVSGGKLAVFDSDSYAICFISLYSGNLC